MLHSECTYDTTRAEPITRGEGLDSEECYFFAYTHPFDAWSERTFAIQGISNACLGP